METITIQPTKNFKEAHARLSEMKLRMLVATPERVEDEVAKLVRAINAFLDAMVIGEEVSDDFGGRVRLIL